MSASSTDTATVQQLPCCLAPSLTTGSMAVGEEAQRPGPRAQDACIQGSVYRPALITPLLLCSKVIFLYAWSAGRPAPDNIVHIWALLVLHCCQGCSKEVRLYLGDSVLQARRQRMRQPRLPVKRWPRCWSGGKRRGRPRHQQRHQSRQGQQLSPQPPRFVDILLLRSSWSWQAYPGRSAWGCHGPQQLCALVMQGTAAATKPLNKGFLDKKAPAPAQGGRDAAPAAPAPAVDAPAARAQRANGTSAAAPKPTTNGACTAQPEPSLCLHQYFGCTLCLPVTWLTLVLKVCGHGADRFGGEGHGHALVGRLAQGVCA